MTIEKKPFVTYALDEDKQESSSEIITLRINKKERELIEELKRDMNNGQDAKILKAGLHVMKNVIHGTFGTKFFRYLTSQDRRRPVYEDTKDDE